MNLTFCPRARLPGRWHVLALLSGLCAQPGVRLGAQTAHRGDAISIRLTGAIARQPARGTTVHAVTTAPLWQEGRVVLPPATRLVGHIDSAGTDHSTNEQWLALHFDSAIVALGDGDTLHTPVTVRLTAIDNARETVDDAGRVMGPRAPRLVHSKRGLALIALGAISPVGALAAAAVLELEGRGRHRPITFQGGTEMQAIFAADVNLPRWPSWRSPPAIGTDEQADSCAQRLPRRSMTSDRGAPADLITLALVGTAAQVRAAFYAAGWDSSGTVSTRANLITLVKAAAAKTYAHQPVAMNVVDGRAPDFVFQKLTNTFVKRHHARVWQSAETWMGTPIWIVAASRDVGIKFSSARRSFSHLIDARVDDERDKVVNDLIAAGRVAALGSGMRDPLANVTVNEGKTHVVTDSRLTILQLR